MENFKTWKISSARAKDLEEKKEKGRKFRKWPQEGLRGKLPKSGHNSCGFHTKRILHKFRKISQICTEFNAKFAKNALELKSKLSRKSPTDWARELSSQGWTPYCHQRLTYWDKRVEQVWRVITAIPDLYSIILYGVWYNILTYFFICVCLENWKSTGESLGQSCLGLPIRPLVFMEHLRLHSTQPLLSYIRKDRRSCGKVTVDLDDSNTPSSGKSSLPDFYR